MHRFLLRDIQNGTKEWYEDCYYNIDRKPKKNDIVFVGDDKVKMKVVAWKYQGTEPYNNGKKTAFYKIATDFLMSLDIPEEWKLELDYLDMRRDQLKTLLNK